MKSLLTLFLFGFSLFTLGQTTCIPLDNATWINANECIDNEWSPPQFRFSYYSTGTADTAIGGGTYRMLFGDIHHSQFVGGIRADSLRAWIYPANDTSEYIFLDFSLEIGDTIRNVYSSKFGSSNYLRDYVVLDTTDNGTFWNLSSDSLILGLNEFQDSSVYSRQYWVYGIGNLRGFPEHNYQGIDCLDYLDCASVNDTSYFPTVGEYQCGYSNFSTSENQKNTRTIYPNPTSGMVYFSSPLQDGFVEIINVNGKVVERKKADAELSVQHLPSGLYTVLLFEGDQLVHREKLAINH
ncbi:MAG: T9SS type A sorting domain-containing protein [Bacteroidetes bacterium]|nr:MAG: T9SS type A sorting domain-containing protein [Bacteroidota bacterium]